MNGSKRIYGFWHVAAIGRWRTIVDSQLAKITASGLYDASHAIFVNVLGTDSPADIPSALRTGKFTASWSPDLEQFEYPTLQILQQHARQEDFYAWYVHVKGASSSSGEPNCPVLRWREYMDYFVLENWRTCAACLPDHDTVGVEWRQVPRLHYSGNFWWANAAYLRRLPPVEELQRATQGNRFFAEFWLGFGSPRAKCLHNFNRDLYLAPYEREEYAEYGNLRLFEPEPRRRNPSREEILRYVHQAGSDSLTVFGGMYEGGYWVQQVPEEIADLVYELQALSKRFVNYLEIGAAAGGVGRLLDDFLGFDAVYVLDDNQHPRAPLRRQNLPQAIEFIGDSHSDACRRAMEGWNVKFDLVLVDGDHSYEGVKQDIELALSFANEGCLFIVHDSVGVDAVARWTTELRGGRIPALRHLFSVGQRLGLEVFQNLGAGEASKTSARRTFRVERGGGSHRQSGSERVAVIFDDKVRPDTTGVYCRRALDAVAEGRHFQPSELAGVSAADFDLFLCIDDGLRYEIPKHLRPCAWWAIDTHLDFPWYRARCPAFDFVFTAQRDGAARLRAEGVAAATWLPLACDPEFHRKHDVPKEFRICFVGALNAPERRRLVGLAGRHAGRAFVGQRFFEEMACAYSASQIVFNRSVANDVNMRVFEALACGSLLLTNDLADNGQDEIFRDGVHLAAYGSDEELLAKLSFYLANDEARERIAAAGRQEALAKHTYRQRMETILGHVRRARSKTTLALSKASDEGAGVRLSLLSPAADLRPQVEAVTGTAAAATETTTLVSIVILTRNQLPFTKQCLWSVLAGTDGPYELIVVDNGSSDGTVQWLRAQSEVRLIENPDNRGFPAGCNQGIRAARGEAVVLLNNDTMVTAGWLNKLLAALHSDPQIGLVGPCTNNISGGQQVPAPYAGRADLDGFAWEWGKTHQRVIEETDRLAGFCLLFRRRLVEEIGLLDEQFGLGNFEDDDYCRRARLAGYRCVIAREAFVHHFGGVTHRGEGIDYGALLAGNQRLYEKKWASQRRDPRIGVSLCMIVRDNAKTLDAALSSIKPWVDEMIVVDTGSVDETPEIARNHGAKVFEFPWCDDFSAARNECIRHARGDWIFWMDSDDSIDADCGGKLRALADQPLDPLVMAYVMKVHCPGADDAGVTVVDHVKMFRNLPQLRFDRRIHEQILPAIRRAGGDVAWTDVFVRHSGADVSPEGRKRKYDRDLRLLNLEIQERPDDPFTLFNLGMTYADMREYERAADFLSRSVVVSPPGDSHVRKAYALLVSSLTELGRIPAAWETCDKGLRVFPEDAELLFRHGILAHRCGLLEEAERAYLAALSGKEERHFSSLDPGIHGFKARHNLAVVYADMGRFADAETEWRRVVREAPEFAPGWRGLGETLVRQRKYQDAATEASRLLSHRRLRVEGLMLQAEISKVEGKLEESLHLLEQAISEFPDEVEPLRRICQALFELCAPERAEGFLQKLVQRDPGDASARHNLGTMLLQLNRLEEAEAQYRASLQLRRNSPATHQNLGHVLQGLGRPEEANAAFAEAERLGRRPPP